MRSGSDRLLLLSCLLLLAATFAVYAQVRHHEFIHLDDNQYVTDNPHVLAGLSPRGIAWAFTTNLSGSWIPLTWLSLVADTELHGPDAGGYHLTNLVLHLANTLLLFIAMRSLTGSPWRSLFVAALFALHPLHVESVAWVTERKDVLSAFFWFLGLWLYARYASGPSPARYAAVLLALVLGLMAKPMVVTLPFVLLLLDLWPLGRLAVPAEVRGNGRAGGRRKERAARIDTLRFRVVVEKAPLVLVATALGLVTYLAQRGTGATVSLEALPLGARFANALVSYVSYLGKTFWPDDLAAFYPHPLNGIPAWQVLGAALFLGLVSAAAARPSVRRRRPYLLVGWLWYLGTLLPVIGLVQVGYQGMADRYTYLPLVGVFIMIAWGLPDLAGEGRMRRVLVPAAATVAVGALAVCTWYQAALWRDSISLFEHALRVTRRNFVMHNQLGLALAERGRLPEAVSHYVQALRVHPRYAEAHTNLGVAFLEQGALPEAAACFGEALRLYPGFEEAHNNMGIALERMGRRDEAVRHYSEALRIRPDYPLARANLERALAQGGG